MRGGLFVRARGVRGWQGETSPADDGRAGHPPQGPCLCVGVVGVGGTGLHRVAGGWWGWHLFPRSEVTDSGFWFFFFWQRLRLRLLLKVLLKLLYLLFDWVLKVMDHRQCPINCEADKQEEAKGFEIAWECAGLFDDFGGGREVWRWAASALLSPSALSVFFPVPLTIF